MGRSGYFSNMFVTMNNFIQKHKSIRKLKSVMYFIDGILLTCIRKPKRKEQEKKKVFIVYNLSLGDGAIFACALQNLRKIYPKEKYEIAIACQKGLNGIYENMNVFDQVIPLNFTKAAVDLKVRFHLFKELRKEYYDIILDPVGPEECTTNVLMTRAIVGDKKITVMNADRECYCYQFIYNNIYNQIISIEGKDISYLEHYTKFFSELGNQKFKSEFTDLPESKTKLELPTEYFIVYPSASSVLKQWPVERFAEIAKRVYEKTKIPLLLCGTGVDEQVNQQLKELLENNVKVIDITGKTSILEFIGVAKKAKYVITNDTGIYHICVVSEVPVAITAGGYAYHRYLMYPFEQNHYKRPYLIIHNMDCFDCENRCRYANEVKNTWPCLDKITVEDAWKVVEKMINEN